MRAARPNAGAKPLAGASCRLSAWSANAKTARLGGRQCRSEALEPYLRGLIEGGDYPHLAPLLAAPGDGTFERGLHWLLDGFARDPGSRRQ